jgi:uncharacterized protein (TIGR00251 family)
MRDPQPASPPLPPFVKPTAEGALLFVKVQPRASRDEIGEVLGSELKVKVTAPPVDSAANEALVRFLAMTIGCSRGQILLQRGQTSRHKVLLLRNCDAREVAAAVVRNPRQG